MKSEWEYLFGRSRNWIRRIQHSIAIFLEASLNLFFYVKNSGMSYGAEPHSCSWFSSGVWLYPPISLLSHSTITTPFIYIQKNRKIDWFDFLFCGWYMNVTFLCFFLVNPVVRMTWFFTRKILYLSWIITCGGRINCRLRWFVYIIVSFSGVIVGERCRRLLGTLLQEIHGDLAKQSIKQTN